MLPSNPCRVSSVTSAASNERCELNPVVLQAFNLSMVNGRLVGPADWDYSGMSWATPPDSNTGGTYLVPESILNLSPIENYKVSTDWLTLSAPNVKPQFETFDYLYRHVLKPLFASLDVDLLVDSDDGPLEGYFISPDEKGTPYFKQSYSINKWMGTPIGYWKEYVGRFLFDPTAAKYHGLTLSITGAGCRALGIAGGGAPVQAFVDFLKADNFCLIQDVKQGQDNSSPWRIKRLDVAVDDYKSKLGGLRVAYDQYRNHRGFTVHNRTPDHEVKGPALCDFGPDVKDTVKDNGTTLYIGKRKHCNKMARIYEKQKERIYKAKVDPEIAALVYPEIRYEVQFMQEGDYFIPVDALLCPLSLWASAFPYFEQCAQEIMQDVVPLPLVRHVPDKVAVVKDMVSTALREIRAKFAKFLRLAQQSGVSSNTIVQAITNTYSNHLPTVWDMEPDYQKPIANETKRVFELYATHSFAYDVPF